MQYVNMKLSAKDYEEIEAFDASEVPFKEAMSAINDTLITCISNPQLDKTADLIKVMLLVNYNFGKLTGTPGITKINT